MFAAPKRREQDRSLGKGDVGHHDWLMAFDDDLRVMCATQYGIAGRRQLRAIGGTRTRIAHRISKGILRPITSQVLELLGTPPSDGKQALAAVLDAPPGAVLSHTSAAA
ncbi:MAG TPA: hypothetical protein VJ815_10775 [Acidimicrobiia bacterium]|nr:hypothetical protein [Acidimicrobiia bacterium]